MKNEAQSLMLLAIDAFTNKQFDTAGTLFAASMSSDDAEEFIANLHDQAIPDADEQQEAVAASANPDKMSLSQIASSVATAMAAEQGDEDDDGGEGVSESSDDEDDEDEDDQEDPEDDEDSDEDSEDDEDEDSDEDDEEDPEDDDEDTPSSISGGGPGDDDESDDDQDDDSEVATAGDPDEDDEDGNNDAPAVAVPPVRVIESSADTVPASIKPRVLVSMSKSSPVKLKS